MTRGGNAGDPCRREWQRRRRSRDAVSGLDPSVAGARRPDDLDRSLSDRGVAAADPRGRGSLRAAGAPPSPSRGPGGYPGIAFPHRPRKRRLRDHLAGAGRDALRSGVPGSGPPGGRPDAADRRPGRLAAVPCRPVVEPEPRGRAEGSTSATTTPVSCLGPRYALLRREFLPQESWRRKPIELGPSRPARILVTLGGTDSQNATSLVLQGPGAAGLALGSPRGPRGRQPPWQGLPSAGLPARTEGPVPQRCAQHARADGLGRRGPQRRGHHLLGNGVHGAAGGGGRVGRKPAGGGRASGRSRDPGEPRPAGRR